MLKIEDLDQKTKEKIFGKQTNQKGDLMNDVITDLVEEGKKLIKDKKNKTAVIGAGLGYLLSGEQKKNRNAIIGGVLGYLLGSNNEIKENDEE